MRKEKDKIKQAFTIQPDEHSPRIEIIQDGRPVSFELLEKLTMQDLVSCRIKVWKKPVKITPGEWLPLEVGTMKIGHEYSPDSPAIEAISTAYSFAQAFN